MKKTSILKNLVLFVLGAVTLATMGAGVLINGNQINPQTAISIATMTVTGTGGMSVTNGGVTAVSFSGLGSALTSLTAANIASGNLGSGVVAQAYALSSIIGPAIAGSTIPLNALNASGASANAGIFYNGTNWVFTTLASTGTWNILGNAGSATKLNALPTACSAGNYPLGVDQGGNAQNCTAAGTGNMSTSISNTMASAAAVRFGAGSYLELNDNTGTTLNTSGSAVWAKSIDSLTESSGCLVAVSMVIPVSTGTLQFTSTTTANLDFAATGSYVMPGILLESCAPLSICRVGISGIYRVRDQSDTANAAIGTGTLTPATDTHRCGTHATAVANSTSMGRFISGYVDPAGFVLIDLGRIP